MKRAGIHEVEHLADFTREAVLDRKDRSVALPLLHRLVSRFERRIGHLRPIGKNALRRDMRESAFHAAVSHLQAVHQVVLPALAHVHRVLQEVDIERAQGGIFHQRAPTFDDSGFLLLVLDREPALLFIGDDRSHRIHAADKKLSHLFVYLPDHISAFLQIHSLTSLFLVFDGSNDLWGQMTLLPPHGSNDLWGQMTRSAPRRVRNWDASEGSPASAQAAPR